MLPHAVRVCVCPADALVRAGMPCRVLALINDSVGCLAASCYHDQATQMGVILGTGTNACIVVPVSRVQRVFIFGDTKGATTPTRLHPTQSIQFPTASASATHARTQQLQPG